MYISEEQIESVVKTLKNSELKLLDGYAVGDVDAVLKEISVDIINNLNEVIYSGT